MESSLQYQHFNIQHCDKSIAVTFCIINHSLFLYLNYGLNVYFRQFYQTRITLSINMNTAANTTLQYSDKQAFANKWNVWNTHYKKDILKNYREPY